jgi:hypothetical protein
MEEGMIWRVGDGEQIQIWDNPWIPSGVTRRPRTPKGSVLLSKVFELIDPIMGTWDHHLICDIFWEEDVQNILSIPIRSNCEDTIAWHFDPKGVFSVKSTYHVLDDRKELERCTQRGESSGSNDSISTERVWKKIWKMKWPPKIKQFLWRVGHNSLAMKLNIKRCGIDLDTRCPICWRLDEDGGHCFLKCKAARACWRGL